LPNVPEHAIILILAIFLPLSQGFTRADDWGLQINSQFAQLPIYA
jgi:hypothetical protein